MPIRPEKHLLLPLLALALILAVAASVRAQESQDRGSSYTSATLRVSFGTSPHWAPVSGTRVEEIPRAERPDYDLFRFDGNYYAYNNNRWYTSRAERGDFAMIDDRAVPSELSRVPREHWYNYPSTWGDGTPATLQVSFGNSPHWTTINGTRVDEIRQAERPNYDLFRFDGNYYAYDRDQWYTSRDERGDFAMIDERAVPRELSRVPREHWRNYPAGWGDGTSATLQVSFGSSPRWAGIHGTRVKEIRGQRPDYDVFRYGGSYYAYRNGQWYSSRQVRGGYSMIDDRSVPGEFSRVPRDHWKNYPAEWSDQNRDPRWDRSGRRY